MCDKKSVYKLTHYGQRAIGNEVFQKHSPQIVILLSEILSNGIDIKQNLTLEVQNEVDMLVELGLLTQPHKADNTQPLNQQSNVTVTIHSIKREFVELLKKDLNTHDKFWDVLLNLESVDDKDGLVWFMSKVTEMTQISNQGSYKKLFEKLMELENG